MSFVGRVGSFLGIGLHPPFILGCEDKVTIVVFKNIRCAVAGIADIIHQ
nr:MAG TPA: hypothetical protein [Caudoviricetes sp.]